MFSPLEHSIVGRLVKKIWIFSIIIFENMLKRPVMLTINPTEAVRDVARAQPYFWCFWCWLKENPRVILLDPAGNSSIRLALRICRLRKRTDLIYVPHYEGYDSASRPLRMWNRWNFLGDYVLTGGELAAMTMIDALFAWYQKWLARSLVTRMIASLQVFSNILNTHALDYRGMVVPDVLMSGHMKDSSVAVWEFKENLRAQKTRPAR